jgi:NodT family efflux transporter outer membrane factor (OMF) lipoprotein
MATVAGKPSLVRRMRSVLIFGFFSSIALGQAGCMSALSEWLHNGLKVGPNYKPPPVMLPQQWIDVANPRVSLGQPNLAAWWDIFNDPVLTGLIHEAFSQNLTVRQAGINILQAQIQRRVALTELLPQSQTLALGYTHGEVSRNNGVAPGGGAVIGTALSPTIVAGPLSTPTTPIAGTTMPLTTAGTTNTGTSPLVNGIGAGAGGGVPTDGHRFFNNIATSMNLSWEVDFWGLFRRNLEAANANLDQQVSNYDVLVIQLLANVATQYVELRTLQKRLLLARQNVLLQEPLVAKLKQQYETGIANSKPAYFQLKSSLDATKALIPPLEILLREANNQLCTLLGIPVRDLVPELGDGLIPDAANPGERTVRIPHPLDERVVLNIPGETLLRRPDVQAMEQQLRIQSAQIGIAEAEMFPHIGINGSIGLAANRLNLLFDQNSWIGSVGPSLTWNILNYGRLLANVRSQNNTFQQFVLAYQQTILNANQDAENALVAYLQSLEQYLHQQDSANAAVEVTKYFYNQLAKGYLPPAATSLAFYNQIFTAVNFQVTQQDLAAQAEGNIALNLVLLYRALGGGWQIRLTDGPGHGVACAPVPAAAAGMPATLPEVRDGVASPPVPAPPPAAEPLPRPPTPTPPKEPTARLAQPIAE